MLGVRYFREFVDMRHLWVCGLWSVSLQTIKPKKEGVLSLKLTEVLYSLPNFVMNYILLISRFCSFWLLVSRTGSDYFEEFRTEFLP